MRKKAEAMRPVLTSMIKNILTKMSKSRTLPGFLVKRSNIILLASESATNQVISKEVKLHYNHAATWRNRFLDALPRLIEIENESPDKLEEEIRIVLSDLQRPGAPSKFTPEQIVKIIDLACKEPIEYGYEVSQWSLSLLVKEITKQGIAERISEKSVSRFLKMRQI